MNRVKLTNPATFLGLKPPVPMDEMTTEEFASWVKIVFFWEKAAIGFFCGALGAAVVLVLLK